MPYEQERVGDNEILVHDIYTDMLLKAAAGAGHIYQVGVEKDEPEKKADTKKKAPAKKKGTTAKK